MPLIHLIYGTIIVGPITIISVVGTIITLFSWIVPDTALTFWTIWTTPKWGPNVKFLVTLAVPFAIAAYVPLMLIASVVFGVIYGLFGPFVHYFISFCDDMSEGYRWLGGNAIEVFKNTFNLLKDYWHFNKSYHTMLYDFRTIEPETVFEIPLYKLPICLMIIIICGLINTIALVFINIIFYLPLTIRLFVELYSNLCCCCNSGRKKDRLDRFCDELCLCCCFFPAIFATPFVFCVGLLSLVCSPFYGLYGSTKAALYSYSRGDIGSSFDYTKDFILDKYFMMLGFINKRDYQFESKHLNPPPFIIDDTKYKKKQKKQKKQDNPIVQPMPSQAVTMSQGNNLVANDKPVNVSLIHIWNMFFKMITTHTCMALSENLLENTDVAQKNENLGINLSSFVILRLMAQSLENDELFILSDGTHITEENRPRDLISADIWNSLIQLKQQLIDLNLSTYEYTSLEKMILTWKKETIETNSNDSRAHSIYLFATNLRLLGKSITLMMQFPRRFGDSIDAALNGNNLA